MTIIVSAFYKFVALSDIEQLRQALVAQCRLHAIKGSILLAPEGINGTIAGSCAAVDAVEAWLRADRRLANLEVKRSTAQEPPFQRLKINIKREIVTFGVALADPALRVGTYVDAKDWNALVSAPDVTVIDTRNAYEVTVGTFPGSLDPRTSAFNEFPQFVRATLDPDRHRKVAMFCTGGIRCEKASAYLLSQGFTQVFHLKGGILKYLEVVPPRDSLWVGECFVFDERVALEHGLAEGTHRLCDACGHPVREPAQGGSCSQCGH